MNYKNIKSLENLGGKTIFEHYISLDKEKLDIYNKALMEGKISHFDQTTMTRLRKLYYGLYSGLIYMYMEPTTFNNIGNKVELLTHVFEDKEYNLVHGDTDSTNSIKFFMCGLEHMDFNSWIEVEEGNKTWVYDPFSLMKIEKEVYYKLENPKVSKIIPKSAIMGHPGRDRDDYTVYHDGFNFMLIKDFEVLQKYINFHPFKQLLIPEIERFKIEIGYDDIVLSEQKEDMLFKLNNYYENKRKK